MCNTPIDYEIKARDKEDFSQCTEKQWDWLDREENIIRNIIIEIEPNYMKYQRYKSIYKEVLSMLLDYCYPMNKTNGNYGMFGIFSDRGKTVFNISYNARVNDCIEKELNIFDICSLIQVDTRSKLYNYLRTIHYPIQLHYFHQIGKDPSLLYDAEKIFDPLIKCINYEPYLNGGWFTSTLSNFKFYIADRFNMHYHRDFNEYGSDNLIRYENHDRMCLSEDIKYVEKYFNCYKNGHQPYDIYYSHDNFMKCASNIDIDATAIRKYLCHHHFIMRNDLITTFNENIFVNISKCMKNRDIGKCEYDGWKDTWLGRSGKIKSDSIRKCQEKDDFNDKIKLLNEMVNQWNNYCSTRYSTNIVNHVYRGANCFFIGPNGNEQVKLCYKEIVRALTTKYDKDYLLCEGFDTIIIRVS